MSAAPMAAPAGVDPRAIRPRRYWYLVAGAVALVALLVPLAGYVVGQLTGPRLTELSSGVTTMTMKTSEPRWLYVSKPNRLVPPPCQLAGPGDVHLDVLSHFPSVDQDGGRWYAIAKVRVTADGRYTLVCVGPLGGARLAVGGDPGASAFAGGLVTNVLVPVLGVLVALALAVLTFVRRRSHRAGMLAAAGTPGGAWGPSGYGTQPGYPAPAQPPPYDPPPPYDYPPPYDPPPPGQYPPQPGQYPPGGQYPPQPGQQPPVEQPPWGLPPQGR